MSIGMVAPSLSREGGGIFFSLLGVCRELAKLADTRVKVFGLADRSLAEDTPLWTPVPVQAFRVSGPDAFGYAPLLPGALLHSDCQLLHVHGLWKYPSVAVTGWAKEKKRPYLVTPHGMLDAWALRNSRWKKRIATVLFEREHLRNASCIHALCHAEAISIRDFGLTNPICVLPNGVDVPQLDHTGEVEREDKVRTLLYLGRIHPKKGLRSLITAWSRFDGQSDFDWRLVVAGWDQAGHEQELKELSCELKLENRIDFIGPQFGEMKDRWLRSADAVILPSLSEGLPMVVLESWSYAKPVLMTAACNLPEGFSRSAALEMEATVDSINAALIRLDAMSDEERTAMGSNGLQLVRERFTWKEVAHQLSLVYAWLAGNGDRPSSIL